MKIYSFTTREEAEAFCASLKEDSENDCSHIDFWVMELDVEE